MWPELVTAFVMMIVSNALQSIGLKKVEQKTPEAGKLDIPTAEEGGSIPVIFGTCMVKSSNVVWYGDSDTKPIKSGGGGKK